MKQKNFVLTVKNLDSPIIISVPHGGMANSYGSWLDFFFKKRIKSEIESENYKKGEKVVIGGDVGTLHIAMEIIKKYPANLVAGLLPRGYVDYNRFVPEVAYFDVKIKPYYDAYHSVLNKLIMNLIQKGKQPILIDFHGFGKQPIEGIEFDIIFGTNNGESTPVNNIDKQMYYYGKKHLDYKIFCAGCDGLPTESEMYKGDTTNLYYSKKYGIDSILVEIAPKFRSPKIKNYKENGSRLTTDFAKLLRLIDFNQKII